MNKSVFIPSLLLALLLLALIFVDFSRAQTNPTPRPQWEYKTVSGNGLMDESALNYLGKEGWEVAAATPTAIFTGSGREDMSWSVILKRPLK